MTKEEYEFYNVKCEAFIEGQSLEEYKDFIHRWLMLSPWHYSSEGATERINAEGCLIEKYYENKEPVSSAAVDVGYACG